MLRVTTAPRADWRKSVESKGLLYHTIDGAPYWNEEAYYLFEAREIDQLEAASYALNEMCLKAVEHVIKHGLLGSFDIPQPFHDFVARSWESDEHTIYGRFDLSFDGIHPPKLLEYNADTPTSLLEAAVIQWFWFQDLLSGVAPFERTGFDQFNSVHERLIEAWTRFKNERGGRVVFSALDDLVEDLMTVTYLRDTAMQAGLKTEFLAIKDIGWHPGRRTFTDLKERPIENMFKLYPWEWLLREPFGRHLPIASTRWLEAPWKMVLSNKAILPVLFELFPGSPYLLRAGYEPFGDRYVVKPIYAREGANITIVDEGRTIAQSDGDYTDTPVIYQDFQPLPSFEGHYPVVGSWIINGHSCGIGLREDDGLITRNSSRFVPHIFRKSRLSKPPTMSPKPSANGGDLSPARDNDPLWDPWVDR